MLPPRYRFGLPRRQSSPLSLQYLCFLVAAEILVPWLLWMIKPIQGVLLAVMSIRLLYRLHKLIAGGHGRLTHLLDQRTND